MLDHSDQITPPRSEAGLQEPQLSSAPQLCQLIFFPWLLAKPTAQEEEETQHTEHSNIYLHYLCGYTPTVPNKQTQSS